MRTLVISLIVAAVAVGGLAGAVDPPDPPLGKPQRHWGALSPEERAALKERYENFKRLPPEQQERLRGRYRRFAALSPEERQALRERLRSFRSLPPEEREQMRKWHKGWQEAPLERRCKIREAMQKRFREMPDKELVDFFRKLSVWNSLPPEERRTIFRRFLDLRTHGHHRSGRRPEGHDRPPR
jgi:hypothetical protein